MSFPLSPNPSQEVTQKLLDAVANIAGSSLEQTSWLSRSLEVKAQPQVSLEDSDAEEDVCGGCGRAEGAACCQQRAWFFLKGRHCLPPHSTSQMCKEQQDATQCPDDC